MRILLLLLAASSQLLAGYSYQRTITLGSSAVIPSSQSNFTVLVCANGSAPCNTSIAGLNQSGAGAHVTSPNGYDIAFSSTACATPTWMKWEMNRYVPSTGEFYAWVLQPTLSSGGTFFLCYGNSAISTFQGGSTGSAWETNYKGVWHLSDGTTLSGADSTANGLNLTNAGATATTGQIDGAANFVSASAQRLGNATGPVFTAGSSITISFWTLVSSASVSSAFSIGNDGNVGHVAQAHVPYSDSTLYWDYGTNTTGRVTTSFASRLGSWTKVDLVFNSSNNLHAIYLGGTLANSTTNASSPTVTLTGIVIGGNLALPYYENGKLDEFRVSNCARSATWIATEYNNQSSPSTFAAVGSESGIGGSSSGVHRRLIGGE
jgi:hypothetical protein